MNESDNIEFYIEVSAENSAEEDIDRITRQLLKELRQLDDTFVTLAKGDKAPPETKAEVETVLIGSILVSTLPTVLPALIALVQDWIARSNGRTVKFKGKGIEFEGPPEELYKLLTTLEIPMKKTK